MGGALVFSLCLLSCMVSSRILCAPRENRTLLARRHPVYSGARLHTGLAMRETQKAVLVSLGGLVISFSGAAVQRMTVS